MTEKNYRVSDNVLMFFLISFTFVVSILLANYEMRFVFGDVFSYRDWSDDFHVGNILGVDKSWVYPYLAIVPMFVAKLFTYVSGAYLTSWIFLIFILYVVALYTFKYSFDDFKWKPYILFGLSTAMLFGLYLGRLDGVAIAVTIIAISLFRKHKTWAIIFLSVGLWIKIWPVAFLLAFFVIDNRKIKFALTALGINIVILLLPLFMGGTLNNILGFVSSQGGRSVQMESLFGLPYIAGLGKTYFDKDLITWQVSGAGVDIVSTLSNYMLIFSLVIVSLVGFILGRKMVNNLEFAILFGSLIMAILIFFNKVGSPQFIGWMIIPVMYLSQIDYTRYRFLIFSALFAMLATGLSAPVFFINIINQDFVGVLMIALKYLGILMFIVGSLYSIWKQSKTVKIGV